MLAQTADRFAWRFHAYVVRATAFTSRLKSLTVDSADPVKNQHLTSQCRPSWIATALRAPLDDNAF